MRLLPVLDLMQGQVVRGIAGNRETYRPIQSRRVTTSDPHHVAQTFRNQFGLETLYLADLDAILYGRPQLEIYSQLANDGFTLLIDAGIHTIQQAEQILEAGAHSLIAGLESTPSPAFLEQLISRFGSQNIIFSLDLKSGAPLTTAPEWESFPGDLNWPRHILTKSLDCGVRRFIVLDLADVGVARGISTLPLCQELRFQTSTAPEIHLELITGGGVRDFSDLELLARSGIDGVLVASALHDGRLERDDVERIQANRFS